MLRRWRSLRRLSQEIRRIGVWYRCSSFVGRDASSSSFTENPLFHQDGLPRYDAVTAEHVKPALTQMLQTMEAEMGSFRESLAAKDAASLTYADVMEELEIIKAPVEYAWGVVDHLASVMDSDELRASHQEMQGPVVELFTKLAQDKVIFKSLEAIQVNGSHLDNVQARVIESAIADMRLGGVDLEGDDQENFNKNLLRLSELSTTFANNVLDSTKEFKIDVEDPADIEGLPASARELCAQSASTSHDGATADEGPWQLGLSMPTYLPAMQHLKNRSLRQQLYLAYVNRAGDSNAPIMEEILRLRKENANILGFRSHAEVSLQTKMAPSVDAVSELTDQLLAKARPAAEMEFEKLTSFAKKNGFEDKELSPWDVPFWSERQSEELFGFDEEELRPYFALENVLDGLFGLCTQLFGIRIVPADGDASVWHEDVRFFNVINESDDTHIASFFLDPYSRPETKRGGAWMNTCVGKSKVLNRKPVAHLVCNASPPVGDKPSLMTFDEVTTLFHETGHGLQHMLTTVEHAAAAGISNVEWDAVELPSQFMENWCYHEKTTVDGGLAVHYETKEPLSREIFQQLNEKRTYNAGLILLRQLFLGSIDMQLHDSFDPSDSKTIIEFQEEIASNILLPQSLPVRNILCSFMHIFAGGYAAGYYSYKWAEVLSADAFEAFEEVGLDNEEAVKATGRRFRDTVLAMGGGTHPQEVFEAFRGRKPSPKALLRHNGLV